MSDHADSNSFLFSGIRKELDEFLSNKLSELWSNPNPNHANVQSPRAFQPSYQEYGLIGPSPSHKATPYYPSFRDRASSSSSSPSSSKWLFPDKNNYFPPPLINDYGYSFYNGAKSPMLSSGDSYYNNVDRPHQSLPRWQQNSLGSADLGKVRGRMAREAQDQTMGAILQKRVEVGCPEETRNVFLGVRDSLCPLAVHKVGNFLVRKLIDFVDEDLVEQIVPAFASNTQHLRTICTDEYGSKVMRGLVERLYGNSAQQTLLVAKLSQIAVSLVSYSNCSQFLEFCLTNYPYSVLEPFLFEITKGHFRDIATHKSGCLLLKHCMSLCSKQLKLITGSGQFELVRWIYDKLMNSLIADVVFLSEDLSGNYVVQKAIEFDDTMINRRIVSQLRGNIFSLSMSKQGSNVIEKLLQTCEAEIVEMIIIEIMENPQPLQLFENEYGNYVIQTALNIAEEEELRVYPNLLNMISDHADRLQSDRYGSNVFKLVRKKLKRDQYRRRRDHL